MGIVGSIIFPDPAGIPDRRAQPGVVGCVCVSFFSAGNTSHRASTTTSHVSASLGPRLAKWNLGLDPPPER